jgi:hypothetical protein
MQLLFSYRAPSTRQLLFSYRPTSTIFKQHPGRVQYVTHGNSDIKFSTFDRKTSSVGLDLLELPEPVQTTNHMLRNNRKKAGI